MLASENFLKVFPACAAWATTLCIHEITLSEPGVSSCGYLHGSTIVTKLEALVSPDVARGPLHPQLKDDCKFKWTSCCRYSGIVTMREIWSTTLEFASAHARACIWFPTSVFFAGVRVMPWGTKLIWNKIHENLNWIQKHLVHSSWHCSSIAELIWEEGARYTEYFQSIDVWRGRLNIYPRRIISSTIC
jgi:hypothetical protein